MLRLALRALTFKLLLSVFWGFMHFSAGGQPFFMSFPVVEKIHSPIDGESNMIVTGAKIKKIDQ